MPIGKRLERLYRFHVQPGSSVLELGCGAGDLLAALDPSRGVGVDLSGERVRRARERHPRLEFVRGDANDFTPDGPFDYVVLSGTLPYVEDVQSLLARLARACGPDMRLVLDWRRPWADRLLGLLGSTPPDPMRNRFSLADVRGLLEASGYEIVRNYRTLASHFVVARPLPPPRDPSRSTASVVITCRDERENIEPLLLRIPRMGARTEILFVEGHSKDGTREEIERVIRAHPDREIRLIVQDGIGQGDAFRKGFLLAEGEFVLWLEADLTTPPEELTKFWEVYLSGRGEYVNGTRMVYPMEKGAMPLLNRFGNRFFGLLFTRLLGTRFTDTLCGLKAISKRNYMRVRKEREYFGDFDPFGDFELIFGAVKNCLKVIEVPVKYRPRSYGTTKTRPLVHGWLLLRMSAIAFRRFP